MNIVSRVAVRYQRRLQIDRIAARFLRAMEFSSQDALDTYMHDHPAGDPKNHSVAEPKDEKGKSEDDHLIEETIETLKAMWVGKAEDEMLTGTRTRGNSVKFTGENRA